MPFDLSTAKPVSSAPSNGGFDLASAKPVDEKPKADFYNQLGTSLRQGFVSSGNLVDRAVSGAAGALANAVSGPDEADKVFREMDERVRQRNQWANPDNVDVGPLAGVLGKIPNLPANLSTALLSPFETGQEMIQNGESLGTAQAGQAISGVGNAIGFVTPAAVGTNIATKLLTGGASNAAQAYAQGKALEAISKTPESQKQFAPTGRSVGEAALLGFGMGAIAPNKPVKDLFRKPNTVLDNLNKQSGFDLETAKPIGEQMELPLATDPQHIAEMQGRELHQPDLFASDQANMQVGGQRAPEPIPEPIISAQRTHDWLAPRKQDSIVEDYGNNDPIARMPEMRVDENGIPIRADLSMENQNLQNPLQRNLWGDELPQLTGDEQIPMTQALDNMPPGIQRNIGMSQLRGFNKPQRGVINMDIMDPTFEKIKELANGIRLVFKGGTEPTVYATKDGQVIGHAAFMRDKFYQDPKSTDTLEARWVQTIPEYQKQHVAREMYKFTTELGNDIQSSSVQTPYGKKMWSSFERQGLTEDKVSPIGVKYQKFKNKQAGKVDIQSIKEEAEKVGKWFSTVGAKAMDNLTPKERIAINAIGDDSYIPKGDSPESIISAAKAQPDGPALHTQMQSGLGGAALKTDSAIMFGVNRHLQWAHKVAAKSFRELVKPIEQKLSLLSTDDAITANGILRKEMFDRKTFTDQQLRDAGASDKVINAYKALRERFNDVYTKTNEARAKLGLEPITQQSAYYSSQWMGNWHMPVYEFIKDKAGNYILDESGARKTRISGYVKTETRAEAKKAMAWIKKNMPEADASSLKIEYKPENIGKNLPRNVTSTFEAMMKIFEDTPMAQQMKEMMDQYRTEQAFNERGFSKHFEEKANTRFFLGDRPWLSDKENAHAGLKSQVQYLKDAYRWIPMQEAMANIKEVLSDPDLVKNQPNNMAVTKAYVANALGVSQSIMRGLENDVAKWTGRSPSWFGKWTSVLKSTTYLQQLGVSAGYAIATPAQAFILGPSRHMLLSKEGFKYNPITTTVKALKDMAALMATHEAYNVTGKDFRSKLSPVGREALRYMEDNGIINMNLFDEYANLGENRPMNLAKNTIGATISFPEKMARTMTFMSFVHHLKEGGMEIGNDMFRKAEELTNATLTEFHKNARPLIVDRMGMTGELMYTYKSPLFNFYNSLFEFGRKASETGDYKPLLTALFMTTALGGIMNFPLMQEMDGAWSLMKDFIAKHFPNFYDTVRDTGIKQFALKHLPDVLTYGAMSSVTGAQMESRFSNQIIDPENPLGNVAPVAQEIKEQAALGNFAMHRNWTTLHEGLYQNLPPAAKGFLETTADSFKAEKRPDGTTTYFNPNKLEDPTAYVNRTKSDETYRKLGLTSLSEARQRDVRYASGQESMRLETARDSSMTKMFDAIHRQDKPDIQKYAVSYFMNDGNENDFRNDFNSRAIKMGLTPEERQAVYLKTISDAKNILRRLQMEQKVK